MASLFVFCADRIAACEHSRKHERALDNAFAQEPRAGLDVVSTHFRLIPCLMTGANLMKADGFHAEKIFVTERRLAQAVVEPFRLGRLPMGRLPSDPGQTPNMFFLDPVDDLALRRSLLTYMATQTAEGGVLIRLPRDKKYGFREDFGATICHEDPTGRVTIVSSLPYGAARGLVEMCQANERLKEKNAFPDGSPVSRARASQHPPPQP